MRARTLEAAQKGRRRIFQAGRVELTRWKADVRVTALMLDPRLIREQPDEVRARLGARGQDIDWDGLRRGDEERRELLATVEPYNLERKPCQR